MPVRKPLPSRWLFTDERQGESLWSALQRLPRGSGIVFRHYGAPNRPALLAKVDRIARQRGLLLVVAGSEKESGPHPRHANRHAKSLGALTASAHSVPDLVRARRAGVRMAFLSPVFATRSHPGARTLGPVRFGLMARQARLPIAALGGMTEIRFRRLQALGAAAWGAISALSAPSKRF